MKNNFDFLRILFALLVLIAHCYPLSGNHITEQWLYKITNGQIELSNIGLNGFFILSGFLIYQSSERSSSIIDFFWKRILRIFPALIVVLLLTLLLTPFVYQNSLPYYKNREVYTYFFKNITLYQLQYSINGVFENNPHQNSINGSLWTIAYEFSLYIFLSFFVILKKALFS